MIKFIKYFRKALPFNWKEYHDFLDDDIDGGTDWKGVSLQLNLNEEINITTENINILKSVFMYVVSCLDDGSYWIINLTFNKIKWFVIEDDSLPGLRNLFNLNDISPDYTGGIMMRKDDLLKFGRELIVYPVFQKRGEIDIVHGNIQFIIKFTNHFEINLLSTDAVLLKEIVIQMMPGKIFIKQYRGTCLNIEGIN